MSQFESENLLFDELLKIDNRKKLLAAVRNAMKTASREAREGFLNRVATSPNPEQTLREIDAIRQDVVMITGSFIEAGRHGFICVNRTFYPVQIKCPANWLKADSRWDPEDEALIGADLANEWMRQNDVAHFKGEVLLFKEFGFSGVNRVYELKCTKDIKGLTKVPGTNYYIGGEKVIKVAVS